MFAKNRYLVIAAILCALGAGIAQAQTWKPVQGSGSSGGGKYTLECAQYNSTGVYCIRTDTATGATECTSASSYGASWDNCPAGAPFAGTGGSGDTDGAGILQGGYFVMTGVTYQGNLGGLTGANATCLSELQSHPWKGKGSAGTLTAARVKAFLCNGTTCQNLLPYTKYSFAKTRFINNGGGSFTTELNGRGPANSTNWTNNDILGSNTYWWSGRQQGGNELWPNTQDSPHCNNWTSLSAAHSGQSGFLGASDRQRWSAQPRDCSNTYPLICMVNPE